MNDAIHQQLVSIARRRELTTYSDIAPLANLDMDNESDRDEISRLLEEIARHEQQKGRPMLTAVVVHRGDDNNPGEGFFAIAADFGRYDGSRHRLRRLEYWVHEVSEVHRHWAQ